MVLGKVVGSVWATCKDGKLQNMKFLIVRHISFDMKLKDSFVVAVDSVGAGAGEIVLIASGSSARLTELTYQKPVDAVIMAIVDKLDIEPGWNLDE